MNGSERMKWKEKLKIDDDGAVGSYVDGDDWSVDEHEKSQSVKPPENGRLQRHDWQALKDTGCSGE
jgi:hypothetical protein